MLADDPADQTLRYMLAMELDKDGGDDRSLELLNGLMQDETPYVPAFLMAGQKLARLGRIQDADTTYANGIQQAQSQGDDHAAGEMTQFKMELNHA